MVGYAIAAAVAGGGVAVAEWATNCVHLKAMMLMVELVSVQHESRMIENEARLATDRIPGNLECVVGLALGRDQVAGTNRVGPTSTVGRPCSGSSRGFVSSRLNSVGHISCLFSFDFSECRVCVFCLDTCCVFAICFFQVVLVGQRVEGALKILPA